MATYLRHKSEEATLKHAIAVEQLKVQLAKLKYAEHPPKVHKNRGYIPDIMSFYIVGHRKEAVLRYPDGSVYVVHEKDMLPDHVYVSKITRDGVFVVDRKKTVKLALAPEIGNGSSFAPPGTPSAPPPANSFSPMPFSGNFSGNRYPVTP